MSMMLDSTGEELQSVEAPDQPAMASSSDVWDKSAFTENTLGLVQQQKGQVEEELQKIRAREEAEGVATSKMVTLRAQFGRGAPVDMDRFIAELIQTKQRVQALENLIIRQYQVTKTTENTVDENQSAGTDIRDAQDQCQEVLLSVLAGNKGEKYIDPKDL